MGIKKIIHHNVWWWGSKDTIILDDGLAFCHIEFPHGEEFAIITDLCVYPQYRKQGYGNRLLDIALDRIKQKGWHKVKLAVDNPWAQSWYERRGFKLEGVNSDGLPIMVMSI